MKYVKGVILALGPIVLIAGIWWWIKSNPNPVPNSITFANVVTGETVVIPTSDVDAVPMKTRDGRALLWPVFKGEDGGWVLDGTFKGALYEALKNKQIDETQLKVDLKTNKFSSN